jgi:tetratricopeptide (TPR) repeat protein
MKKDKPIKITSTQHKELNTSVIINGKKYLVMTEDIGTQNHLIKSKVYLGGKIISSKNTDYKDVLQKPDLAKRIRELMQTQHDLTLKLLKHEKSRPELKPLEYLDKAKSLLQRKNLDGAISLLATALNEYPDEPYLVSYYGCFEAIINRNYKYGIETCQRAIRIVNEKMPYGQEFFYPTLYLNLGRSYLAAKKKKNAFDSFQKGIAYDKENRELKDEIRKLGIRRNPLLPVLKRSHPINKYLGKILNKIRRD